MNGEYYILFTNSLRIRINQSEVDTNEAPWNWWDITVEFKKIEVIEWVIEEQWVEV